jgi:hypothetical protein
VPADPPVPVPAPWARARAVAERMAAAAGTRPRWAETPDAVRVEVEVPETVGLAELGEIVTAMREADRCGHDLVADRGVAWAEFDLGPGGGGGQER